MELLLSQFVPTAQTASSCETYEQIETGLNVLLLILCRKHRIDYEKQDFSQLEIDFVSYYLTRNGETWEAIQSRLPGINDLYSIAENRSVFYPFGTIKSYTALSILISSETASLVDDNDFLKTIDLKTMLLLMKSVSNDREIDDVTNATWKFANSVLATGKADFKSATENELLEIISHLYNISYTYKLAQLR